MNPIELLQRWQVRVIPIVTRMEMHCHAVDSDRLDATVALIMRMETGHDDCFSAENAHRSHHLPDCPWAPRNRGPKAPPEQAAATKAAVAAHRVDAFTVWAQEVMGGVNRRFSPEGAGPPASPG
jgi:hypothetical protein